MLKRGRPREAGVIHSVRARNKTDYDNRVIMQRLHQARWPRVGEVWLCREPVVNGLVEVVAVSVLEAPVYRWVITYKDLAKGQFWTRTVKSWVTDKTDQKKTFTRDVSKVK